jgi:hypothetical protein
MNAADQTLLDNTTAALLQGDGSFFMDKQSGPDSFLVDSPTFHNTRIYITEGLTTVNSEASAIVLAERAYKKLSDEGDTVGAERAYQVLEKARRDPNNRKPFVLYKDDWLLNQKDKTCRVVVAALPGEHKSDNTVDLIGRGNEAEIYTEKGFTKPEIKIGDVIWITDTGLCTTRKLGRTSLYQVYYRDVYAVLKNGSWHGIFGNVIVTPAYSKKCFKLPGGYFMFHKSFSIPMKAEPNRGIVVSTADKAHGITPPVLGSCIAFRDNYEGYPMNELYPGHVNEFMALNIHSILGTFDNDMYVTKAEVPAFNNITEAKQHFGIA